MRRSRRRRLPALFDAFTAKWAAKPALEYRDRRTSYAELRAAVEAVASGLMDLGVGPGTAVALYLPNTPYHPFVVLRRAQGGGRVVHLSPLDAERELAYKLEGLRRAHPGHHQHRLHGRCWRRS